MTDDAQQQQLVAIFRECVWSMNRVLAEIHEYASNCSQFDGDRMSVIAKIAKDGKDKAADRLATSIREPN